MQGTGNEKNIEQVVGMLVILSSHNRINCLNIDQFMAALDPEGTGQIGLDQIVAAVGKGYLFGP